MPNLRSLFISSIVVGIALIATILWASYRLNPCYSEVNPPQTSVTLTRPVTTEEVEYHTAAAVEAATRVITMNILMAELEAELEKKGD